MKYLAALLLCSGLILFGNVALPIALPVVNSWFTPHLLDPSADSANPNLYVVNVLGVSTSDYSSPEAWFNVPSTATPEAKPSLSVKYFSITIPSVKLLDVPVEIAGEDLKKNAIQFTSSALPGDYGNVVVFGHSALPQFYQHGNPLTIFNPLLRVQIRDEIVVSYDGILYKYIVKDTAEVEPTEVSVLAQHYDRRELTLITCTPLGTYWHRFVVRAELQE